MSRQKGVALSASIDRKNSIKYDLAILPLTVVFTQLPRRFLVRIKFELFIKLMYIYIYIYIR